MRRISLALAILVPGCTLGYAGTVELHRVDPTSQGATNLTEAAYAALPAKLRHGLDQAMSGGNATVDLDGAGLVAARDTLRCGPGVVLFRGVAIACIPTKVA